MIFDWQQNSSETNTTSKLSEARIYVDCSIADNEEMRVIYTLHLYIAITLYTHVFYSMSISPQLLDVHIFISILVAVIYVLSPPILCIYIISGWSAWICRHSNFVPLYRSLNFAHSPFALCSIYLSHENTTNICVCVNGICVLVERTLSLVMWIHSISLALLA